MDAGTERIAQLVSEIQNGNGKAFDELYKLTSSRAYFVALQITKNEQDAEDVLQESYVNALAKINSLEKPGSFVSWFHHIVANKSKDSLKKKKPTLFEGGEDEAFEVIPDEDTSFSPEDNLNQAELQKAVMEVIGELTEEKRACVLMMYFEEMSVNEIAETLEVPVSTVKNRLFTARKDLKAKFEKRGITCVYSAAPIGVVIWALSGMAEAVSETFTGSAASAGVLAKITAASSATAATTAAAATGGTVAASTAASAGTGVAAKVAALTVAQKVVAGVAVTGIVTASAAGVATVVNNSVKEETTTSTTAYTEEITTLPTTVLTSAIMAIIESTTETTTEPATTVSTTGRTTTKKTTERTTATTTVKTTASTTVLTEPTATTSVLATTTATTKPKTTRKTTTRRDYSLYTSATTASTTEASTTVEETTTRRRTTTTTSTTTTTKKPETTKKPTTTEPETNEITTTTTKASPATVVVNVYDINGTVIDVLYDSVEAGETLSADYVSELALNAGYSPDGGIYIEEGENHSFGDTAQAGETYKFMAQLLV